MNDAIQKKLYQNSTFKKQGLCSHIYQQYKTLVLLPADKYQIQYIAIEKPGNADKWMG